MTNYVATIMDLVPNAKISYTGVVVDYDAIQWFDERPKPSRADCDARWVTLEVEMLNASMQRSRAIAYREEADPLFFGWQRGENTETEWLDKVAEIRAKYPYVE
jgi:hypothetical protein